MTRKKKNNIDNSNRIIVNKITDIDNNFVEDNRFYFKVMLSEHFDNFLNIYNDIKQEAEFISDTLLSNDLHGFKNVSSKIFFLIENSLDLDTKLNDDVKDYSDNDEEYIDNF